jgi:hypothetical protein
MEPFDPISITGGDLVDGDGMSSRLGIAMLGMIPCRRDDGIDHDIDGDEIGNVVAASMHNSKSSHSDGQEQSSGSEKNINPSWKGFLEGSGNNGRSNDRYGKISTFGFEDMLSESFSKSISVGEGMQDLITETISFVCCHVFGSFDQVIRIVSKRIDLLVESFHRCLITTHIAGGDVEE